jgi:hypothetical protein
MGELLVKVEGEFKRIWARTGVIAISALMALTPEPKSGSGATYEALTAARHPLIGTSAVAITDYTTNRFFPGVSRAAKATAGAAAIVGLSLAVEIAQSQVQGLGLLHDANYPLGSFENLKDLGFAFFGGAAYAATRYIGPKADEVATVDTAEIDAVEAI